MPPLSSRSWAASAIAAADGCCCACAPWTKARKAMAAAPTVWARKRTIMVTSLPVKPNDVRSRPLDDASAGRAREYDGLREPDKETVLDNAGNGRQPVGQHFRIGDP